MNWDVVKADWAKFKGKASEEWDKLTDEDLEKMKHGYEHLVSAVQQKYGLARDEAEKRVKDWHDKHVTPAS